MEHRIPSAPPRLDLTKPKSNSTSWLRRTCLCALLVVSVVLSGCATREQSALLGAAIGGGAGYALGRSAHNHHGDNYRKGYRDSRYGYRYDRRDSRGYYDRRGFWHRY